MRKCFFVMVFSLLGIFGLAGITNIAKINELSTSDKMEMYPFISHNGLTIYYLSRSYTSDKSLESYVQATRLITTSPFDNITTAPFANVMSATGWEGPFWVSDNGLRMYFSSDRDGTMDIFLASRVSTSVPFSAPTKLAAINSDTANDLNPVLANDEFTIYFTSNRGLPFLYDIYRATRSDTALPFGAPTIVDELSHYNYSIVDVSFVELEIVLYGTSDICYSHRDSESSPFSSRELVYDFGGSTVITGASLNGDWSKIYYGTFDGSSSFDLYAGDFSLSSMTPTPTPTPVLPTPVPSISVAVSRDQIGAYTTHDANPWGGAFDSQGRYIFFDQYLTIPGGSWGTDQLIRVSFTGGAPSFSTIASRADLAADDSRWNTQEPVIKGLDVLSDDSIVMLVFFPSGILSGKILRIVPGITPQVTAIAYLPSFSPSFPVCMVVDRTSTPNIIYMSYYADISKITADQVGGSLSLWVSNPFGGYIYGMDIDSNGNVLCGGPQLSTPYEIIRINKDTKALTVIYSGLELLYGHYYASLGLAINPQDQGIFSLYRSATTYPYTQSAFNILSLKRETGGTYTASDYVTGYQIFSDPDVQLLSSYPTEQLVAPASGFRIDPTGDDLFISNGGFSSITSYTYPGSRNIIKVSTSATLDAMPHWVIYE